MPRQTSTTGRIQKIKKKNYEQILCRTTISGVNDMHETEKIRGILEVIRDEVLPLTESQVACGNHVFGGAIMRADTMTSVMVGSNNRVENPLLHGEIDTLNRFFKLPVRPRSEDLLFVATHDPCPMCAAAIAWAGFKELWVLFNYKDVEAEFDMPVDLLMYREVFGVEGVRPNNRFFSKHSLKEAVAESSDRDSLQPIFDEIKRRYAALEIQDFPYPGM